MGDPSEPKFHGGSPATTMASQVQHFTSKMSLELCLSLAVVALLATAIPLVGAQTPSDCVDTNNNAVNLDGKSCSQLLAIANEMRDDDRLDIADFCAKVSQANSANFTVNEMCCTCGGGSDWIPPLQSNEPTTYVQGPISTTCFDLKSSFQNSLCCSKDMGKAATFNGTAVTCGTVLASYTSSECCDADLAKNATMTFPASTLLPTSEPPSTNTPSQTSTDTPSTTPQSTSEPTSEATSTNTPSQTSTDTPSTTPP